MEAYINLDDLDLTLLSSEGGAEKNLGPLPSEPTLPITQVRGGKGVAQAISSSPEAALPSSPRRKTPPREKAVRRALTGKRQLRDEDEAEDNVPIRKRLLNEASREMASLTEKCTGPRSQTGPSKGLTWPKSFLGMTDAEAKATLLNFSTVADRKAVQDLSHSQREASMVNYILKAAAMASEVVGGHAEAADLQNTINSQKKELKTLRAEVRDLRGLNSHLKNREDQLLNRGSELEKKLDISQDKEKSLKAQISRLKKDHEAAMARLKRDHEAEVTKLSADFFERESLVRAEGMKSFRDRFLLSPLGQDFLKMMHEGIRDRFKLSKEYFVGIVTPCSACYKHGFSSAANQAASQGFTGTFDQKGPFRSLNKYIKWEGDHKEDKEFPWWHQPIQAACRLLLGAPARDEDLVSARSLTYPPAPPTELPAESSRPRDDEGNVEQ